MRPASRLRFTRSGGLLMTAIVVLGLATLNTGNNLLYLVLGGLLGLIVLSGFLSEQVLSGLSIRRTLPRAGVAGEPIRIAYEVTNRKLRFPSLALDLVERGLDNPAHLAAAWPGQIVSTQSSVVVARRGVYRLDQLTLRTAFPFGLFIKERELEVPGALIVWPRCEGNVRAVRQGGDRVQRFGKTAPAGANAGRGDYRSLRAFLPGDDPRDVHWRSTARRGEPVVREHERDAAETLWLCLDLRTAAGDAAESLVEIAAALAARAARGNERFGLASCDGSIEPGSGPGQLEAVLDTLACVRFRPDAPPLIPPADPAHCVLLAATEPGDRGYADYFTPVVA